MKNKYILCVLKSIKSVIATEIIKTGTKRGKVKILVIESLLFLDIVIDAVIEDIKITLKRDSIIRILTFNKQDKSMLKIIKIRGENIKKKTIRLKYIIIFFTKIINSKEKGERIY